MKRLAKTYSCWLISQIAFGVCCANASDWPQWRGPNRDGISPEKGLLQQWPKDGPKLLWKLSEIGSGYATPSVAGDRVFLLANDGLENEFVAAFALADGKKLWSTRLGPVGKPKQDPNFPAARSTPTVDGDFIYALGSDGDLACLAKDSGKVRWRKNLRGDFGGKPGTWAYAESPLVDGDTLVCSPGGAQATLLALHKTTGHVLWKCALPEADEAAYASALVIQAAGRRQYVQFLQKGLAGVDATTGQLLWRFSKPVSRFNANIPTPVAGGDIIFAAAAGTGAGAVKLRAKEGRVIAEPLYFEAKLPTAIGGAVKLGDLLYGTTGTSLTCLEFATGTIKWEDRAPGPASLCYADGRLYLHAETGEVALVEPSAETYIEKGRFTPPGQPTRKNGMEKAWAYPVVAHGRLFIRDHGCLWCFDVKG